MKIKVMTTLTILSLVALLITGCSSTNNSNIVRVIKIAPENTLSIIYLDFETMKKDPDCEQKYYDMRDSIESIMKGIQLPDITCQGMINVEKGTLNLQIGEYDVGNIRDNLKAQGYTEDQYQGSEIWTGDMYGLERAFTFIDNMFVFGDTNSVEASLRAYKNDEPSLYDNEDLKMILDELPEGIFHMVINTTTKQHITRYGSAIGSISICNLTKGDEVLDIKGLFKFESEADAETYLERTEDIAEAFFFGIPVDVEVELKGQLIEITGTTDIEDFF